MDVIGCGNGGVWGWKWEPRKPKPTARSKSSTSLDGSNGGSGLKFPIKQAITASSLALTGDTIAQLRDRWRNSQRDISTPNDSLGPDDSIKDSLLGHDWLRSLRMTSYGFFFYGPGSYAWYQLLDHCMPMQTVQNLMLKVLLNQIVLGPCVIAVVFAWNNLWQGKLSQLPNKYKKDALPTLLYGFRFWIPVSVLNFWVVPLQARVGFMSMGSIFWNFYLSATMSR